MGHGGYDYAIRHERALNSGYYTKSFSEVSAKELKNEMSPKGVKIRESRDSNEHPNSFPIIIALDVTGSMGDIPQLLVRNGLPTIMSKSIENGVKDPQVLFLAIGDHTCDRAPLQVGQFESSDELLDKWLTSVWFEGKGGGNLGESYLLAHYFAARHTITDHFEKRGKKGLLITIGDEDFLKTIREESVSDIMGYNIQGDITQQIINECNKMYNVYHIHVNDTYQGSLSRNYEPWKQLLGNNCITLQTHELIPQTITGLIVKHGEDIMDSETIPSIKKEDKIIL